MNQNERDLENSDERFLQESRMQAGEPPDPFGTFTPRPWILSPRALIKFDNEIETD